MTAQKPEALRLADKYEVEGFLQDHRFAQNEWCGKAAVELRRLHAENEALRSGYDASRLEIESLRARVQELGQMLRENRSKRIVALEAENLGLLHALAAEQDANTDLRQQLEAIGAGGVEPLRRDHFRDATEMVPVGWAISYDGKNPHALWTAGEGDSLDLEVKRQGGTACKMALYAALQPPTVKDSFTDHLRGATKMMQAAQQALEALEAAVSDDRPYLRKSKAAIAALREALEAPAQTAAVAQEPVALLVRKNSWRDGQWEAAPPNSPHYGLSWADKRMYVYSAPQPTKPAPNAELT